MLAVCSGLGVCVLAAPPAYAQVTPAAGAATGELDRQYDEAFQEMLKQPANLDVLFKFATVASQTGDLEGAISALERMLLVNADLPRVRLELGVLYFRLGSTDAAAMYLEAARASPEASKETRERAETFLKAAVR